MSWQVPAYEPHDFFSRRTRFCLCIPVLDEDGRFRRQLTKMRGQMDLADVIVADGGSTDGSTEPKALRDAGVRALLVKTGPGRLGAQLLHVRRIDQHLEGNLPEEAPPDDAGVADERALHGSSLPRQAEKSACRTAAPPRTPRIFDGISPRGYSRRTGTSTMRNPSRAARIDK